jgi:hypothetical protein
MLPTEENNSDRGLDESGKQATPPESEALPKDAKNGKKGSTT